MIKKKRPVRNAVLLILTGIIIAAGVYIFLANYIDSLPKLRYVFMENAKDMKVIQPQYPKVKFAVMSDLHYYDVQLGTTGAAFQKYLDADRKLLSKSAEILNFAVNDIIASGVKFALISGDLTKDGELLDHQQVAIELNRLKEKGIQVYVAPGNHDVNNSVSYQYKGDQTIQVPNVSAQKFSEIYKDYGYNQAVFRHPASLSYVVEPTNNLWLVSIDANRYQENKTGEEPIVGGKFTQSLVAWLEEVFRKANALHKPVMVMVHQGVVEHWKGQSKLHPEYLLEDYTHISEMLASYGVRLAFTGHYHAQDIVKADFKEKGYIVDIETGSLVTPPCPLRYCTIDAEQKLIIQSKQLIKTVRPETDFEQNASKFVNDSIVKQAFDTLRKYAVNKEDALLIAKSVGEGFIAHYNGDENIANMPKLDESKLQLWSRIILSTQRYVIDGLWKDLSPSDNNCVIDLNNGK